MDSRQRVEEDDSEAMVEYESGVKVGTKRSAIGRPISLFYSLEPDPPRRAAIPRAETPRHVPRPQFSPR
jgi:hypothetical protein